MRNAGCNPAALANRDVPYNGEIIPANCTLVERNQWWPPGQMVDVYDENKIHAGYFYDMHMFFFMRFGYSDASGQIWFEAQYPNFFSRFRLGQEYQLQRCDVGEAARTGAVFDISEDYHKEPWCFFTATCARLFTISRRDVKGEVSDQKALSGHADFAPPPAPTISNTPSCKRIMTTCGNECPGDTCQACIEAHGLDYDTYTKTCVVKPAAQQLMEFDSTTGAIPVGSVVFNGTREWIGGKYQTVWNMQMKEKGGVQIADAQQHFKNRGVWRKALSRWSVNTTTEDAAIPNWVIAFMAALDDIDES